MERLLREETIQAIEQSDLNRLQELVKLHSALAVRLDEDPDNTTALHIAAACGDWQIVNYLVSEAVQADPSAARINNFTPLHAAAMFGHTDVCQLLIDSGATVNIQTDPQGYAPLHSAAYGGHLDTIKVLLAHGANPALRNYRNEYPVDTAKRQNQQHVVSFLSKLSQ
ncbi:ankyrin repeat domain-containing protein [Coleofasciculus sp.]|uniref:ankyrin repeat domain-containing protein n=1 Tax=Coleofasciculus sp. TaxID=3100458 RepID=UPI003A49C329